MSPTLTANRPLSCRSRYMAITARHALSPVNLERRQAAVCRRQIWRPVQEVPVLYRRYHQHARDQRHDEPVDKLLQAFDPGFEAPVLLAYSARNRSASCRIPFATSAPGKRIEIRFPDPTANPYLAFTAMLMAGLDGIENKSIRAIRWTKTFTNFRRKS